MQRVTDALGYPTGTVKIVIADSKDLNAASFGHGVFVFWDGVADLPAQSIDAIAAHEFAHDVLRHSKKTEELQDVTQFFGNLVGLVGGASEGGQQVVSAWIDLASLPKYSRAQEFEADELAVVTLGQMGFPNGEVVFTELLETLQRHYGEAGGGLWDTHPGISERLAKIQQRADKESELGPTSGAPSR